MPPERPLPGRPRLVGTALGLTGLGLTALVGLAACTSGGTGATAGQSPVEVTVTSTTSPAATVPSATPSASSASSSTTAGAGIGGQTSTASPGQTTSALPTCQPSQMTIRVEAMVGGGTAGGQVLDVRATNTGSSPCVTQGYPGLSLVAPGTGKQLGAAAVRAPGESGTSGALVRLEPGGTAVARVKISRAENYGAGCSPTTAAGFRVYLPGTTAAAYAPYAVPACSVSTVHQLEVQPFTG
ncbi:MAG: DUF4232 domain-containing protein [Actinomycetota bacterium]|nr:DUF4232 domain-containing protein [Actinomycetota bacterium]